MLKIIGYTIYIVGLLSFTLWALRNADTYGGNY